MMTAALAAGSLFQTPAQPAEVALRAQVEALAAAIHRKDAAALDALLAPEFTMRGTPDLTRGQWIENAVGLCWGERSEIDAFQVRMLPPDSAVVSFVSTFHQDPRTCEPAVLRSLVTDVWIRQSGTWRLAARHASAAAPGDQIAPQFAKEAPPPPAIEGKAELSFVSTGGNTDTETLGTAGTVIWRAGRWKTEGAAGFVRASNAGTESARSLVLEARESWSMTPRVELFGRGGFLRDVYAGIDGRVTLDAGVGWQALERARHSLRLDGGLGYLDEQRLTGDDLRSAILQMVAKYRWAITDAAEVTNDASFVTPFSETDDWRYANTVSVSAALSRLLSLKLSHALTYRHEPVPGFRSTDTIVSAALVAKFAR